MFPDPIDVPFSPLNKVGHNRDDAPAPSCASSVHVPARDTVVPATRRKRPTHPAAPAAPGYHVTHTLQPVPPDVRDTLRRRMREEPGRLRTEVVLRKIEHDRDRARLIGSCTPTFWLTLDTIRMALPEVAGVHLDSVRSVWEALGLSRRDRVLLQKLQDTLENTVIHELDLGYVAQLRATTPDDVATLGRTFSTDASLAYIDRLEECTARWCGLSRGQFLSRRHACEDVALQAIAPIVQNRGGHLRIAFIGSWHMYAEVNFLDALIERGLRSAHIYFVDPQYSADLAAPKKNDARAPRANSCIDSAAQARNWLATKLHVTQVTLASQVVDLLGDPHVSFDCVVAIDTGTFPRMAMRAEVAATAAHVYAGTQDAPLVLINGRPFTSAAVVVTERGTQPMTKRRFAACPELTQMLQAPSGAPLSAEVYHWASGFLAAASGAKRVQRVVVNRDKKPKHDADLSRRVRALPLIQTLEQGDIVAKRLAHLFHFRSSVAQSVLLMLAPRPDSRHIATVAGPPNAPRIDAALRHLDAANFWPNYMWRCLESVPRGTLQTMPTWFADTDAALLLRIVDGALIAALHRKTLWETMRAPGPAVRRQLARCVLAFIGDKHAEATRRAVMFLAHRLSPAQQGALAALLATEAGKGYAATWVMLQTHCKDTLCEDGANQLALLAIADLVEADSAAA